MKIVTKYKKGKKGQDVFDGSYVIDNIPFILETPVAITPPSHLEKTPTIEKIYADYKKNIEDNKIYEGSFDPTFQDKSKEELTQIEAIKKASANKLVVRNFIAMGFSEDEINEIVIEKNPKIDYSDRARDIYDYLYSIKIQGLPEYLVMKGYCNPEDDKFEGPRAYTLSENDQIDYILQEKVTSMGDLAPLLNMPRSKMIPPLTH